MSCWPGRSGIEGYARVTIQTYASTLRAFFRYAEGRGWCRPGLAAAIMAPRVFPYEALPAGLSWDDVNRALAAAQGDRPADIRDRALLMLLAVYGLRCWRSRGPAPGGLRLASGRCLTVRHGKRQKPRTYPLCRPVGDAVLRYLREVRPRSSRREVFLTLRAPFRPLTRRGLGQVGQPAAPRPGRDLAPLRPPRSAARLRHPPAGAGAVAEGDRRPPRAPVTRDDPHLCQGRSGRTAGRRGLRPGGPAMTINDLVTHYVTFRRTLGERCQTNEAILRSFCRAVGPQTPVASITAAAVDAFLAGSGPVTSTWHIKYHALKGSSDSRSAAGIWTKPRCRRSSRSGPRASSRTSTRGTSSAACWTRSRRTGATARGSNRRPCGRSSCSCTGPGLRAGEALDLTVADVDLPNALLTIRDTKFFKSRLVPIGRDLTGVLTEYARWRDGDASDGRRRESLLPRQAWGCDSPADVGGHLPTAPGTRPGASVRRAPATNPGCTTCGTRSRSTA